MASVSSWILSGVTLFRNEHGSDVQWGSHEPKVKVEGKATRFFKVISSEAIYLALIPFSIIETALSLLVCIFNTLGLVNFGNWRVSRWAASSGFSIGRSIHYAVANFFCSDLIVNENLAKKCAKWGIIFYFPHCAGQSVKTTF